jgi:hypothetical protein
LLADHLVHMKCPACHIVCSDEKDLCPKCHVDLRNFKRALGLPISSPNTPYRDLLNTLKRGHITKDPSPSPSAARPPGATPAPQKPTPSPADEWALAFSFEDLPPPKKTSPPSPFPEKQSTETEVLLTGFDLASAEPPPLTPVPGRAPKVLAEEHTPDLWPEEEPTVDQLRSLFSFGEEELTRILEKEAAKTSPAPSPEPSPEPVPSPSTEPVTFRPAPLPPPEPAPPDGEDEDGRDEEIAFEIELEAPSAPRKQQVYELDVDFEEPDTTPPRPSDPPAASRTISVSPVHRDPMSDELFDTADRVIARMTTVDLEFSASQFYVRRRTEELDLLFALAEEALIDPTLRTRYRGGFIESQTRTVEAHDLTESFRKIEVEMQTPRLSLARGIDASTAEPAVLPPPEYDSGSLKDRILCSAVDLSVPAVLSGSAVLSALRTRYPDAWARVLALEPQTLDLIFIAGYFIGLFPFAVIVYHLVSFLLFRTTMGLSYTGVRLVGSDHYDATISHLLLRAISWPALSLGAFLTFLGKPSLVDLLAHTRLVRDRNSATPQ